MKFKRCEALTQAKIKKWFNEFCFEVEVKEVLYYKYGWGCLRRYRLVIKPNPNCL